MESRSWYFIHCFLAFQRLRKLWLKLGKYFGFVSVPSNTISPSAKCLMCQTAERWWGDIKCISFLLYVCKWVGNLKLYSCATATLWKEKQFPQEILITSTWVKICSCKLGGIWLSGSLLAGTKAEESLPVTSTEWRGPPAGINADCTCHWSLQFTSADLLLCFMLDWHFLHMKFRFTE